MEIHQLQYAVAVAKYKALPGSECHQHFTTVSFLAINKLEEELGIKIFERTTRTVRLTRGDGFYQARPAHSFRSRAG